MLGKLSKTRLLQCALCSNISNAPSKQKTVPNEHQYCLCKFVTATRAGRGGVKCKVNKYLNNIPDSEAGASNLNGQ